jgi:cold shock CspA family protein
MERKTGELVTWRDDDGRRFGFLRPDGADGDVYVSGAALEIAGVEFPRVGERFTFDVVEGRRGDRAVDVRRAGVGAAAEQVFNPPRREPVRP